MAQVPEPAPWVASGDETDRVRGPPAFPRSGIVDMRVRLPAGPFTVCADGKWAMAAARSRSQTMLLYPSGADQSDAEHQAMELAVGVLINRSNALGSRPEDPRRRFFEV